MKFSRRDFIKFGGAAIAALGTSGLVFAQPNPFSVTDLPSAALGDPLLNYDSKVFRQHLNSRFTLMTEQEALPAVLVGVKDLNVSNQASRQCFLLSFRTTAQQHQATYKIFHPVLGYFNLFLVPGKNTDGRYLLQAVINRV
ncbi:MAG TPA: twin-arginine translocation signal domain-containing protein [Pyrinomonadaceae bacterium]|jgi:hypothetical protein